MALTKLHNTAIWEEPAIKQLHAIQLVVGDLQKIGKKTYTVL